MSDSDEYTFPAAADLSASSDAIEISFAMVDATDDFKELALELRAGAQHAETAAAHMIAGEIALATSHAFAVQAHMNRAQKLLDARAEDHLERL